MQESPLRREVLLPRPRTTVVLLSALAMFAAVVVSALALGFNAARRDHDRAMAMRENRCGVPKQVGVDRAVASQAGDCDPVSDDHDARMWRLFVTSVKANMSDTALYAYGSMSEDSPNRLSLQAKRDEIASRYHDQQMRLVARELERNDFTAATTRVAHLAKLVPERGIDTVVCR